MPLRTVSNTGGNWNATSAWVGGVVPIAGDTVDFTATSGNLVVNVVTAVLTGINFTNYVGTITFNNPISTSGAVNLGTGGYTQAGASGLVLTGTATITSNGTVWSRSLSFTGTSITYTLADTLSTTGTVSLSGSTTTILNGNTLNIGGTLTTTTSATTSGTTAIVFNGASCTWSNSSTGVLRNNTTINTVGTLTISGTVRYDTGTFTYTAGTVVSTGSTLISSASTTFNTVGMSWNNVTFNGTSTMTLTTNMTVGGTLLTQTNAVTINGASRTLYVGGNITVNHTLTGTAAVELTGTGTWSSTGYNINNNLIFNNGANTFTISGTVYYATNTMTYTSGTIVTTGSTLVPTNCTLNTTFNWANIYYYGTTTITMASNLNFTGVGNFPVGTITFAGAAYTLTILGTVTVQTTTWWAGQTTLTLAGTSIFGALVRESNFGSGQFWGATINGGSLEVRGNYTVNAGPQGGSTIITLTATGGNVTWTGGGGNQVIMDAGTNTITVPSGTYTGGTITRVSGNVIFSTFSIGNACTIDLRGAYIPSFTHIHNTFNGTNYASTLTLVSDFYVGLFDQAAATSALGNTYVINTTGGTMYLKSLKYTSGAFATDHNTTGNGTLVFNGEGYINKSSNFATNIIFDNPETTNIISFPYSTGTMTYKKGKFTRTSILTIAGNATVINFDKASTLKRVNVTSGITLTVNQLFNGDSSQPCILAASSTTNYNLQFTDTFERFVKFIDIRNCTLVRPNQLVVAGNHRQKGTNIGIRYTNQSPNGLPKFLTKTNPSMTFDTGGLIPDPNFIKLK